MALIIVGSKVTVRGISGFGMVQGLIYCSQSKKTLLNVELYRTGEIQYPVEIMPLDAEDCTPFEVQQGRAKRIYATPDDSINTYLAMAGV